MPTPVTTARQCLTPEAAHALDEAVNVAKRRGHGQTTSLHAVSALLSLPSSPLRDACSRARGVSSSSSAAYPVRLQFKALELCLGVSLDRVPSSGQPGSDPPVSNSLMAAIKRSQANQRRQPESFHVYQQQLTQLSSSGGSPSSMSCVKVELRNLILSILDDPVVSRVFGEAGFRSPEIKLAILRPAPQIFRVKGPHPPPMFLCNLEPGPDPCRVGFGLRYAGSEDDSWSRIGEVFGREKGRNPVLVGASAFGVLEGFSELVEKRKDRGFSPLELSGLRVIGLGRLREEKGCLVSKFQEVGRLVNDESLSLGVVLNLGDLKVLVDDEERERGGDEEDEVKEESLGYLVGELSKLLRLQGGKTRRVWVIGALERYEIYRKLVSKFPCIEKDWDLQLLPITSFRTTPTSESYPRSSLMESFIPFGGFFSTPSDFYGPLSTSYQRPSRCSICNEKCEQEIDAVSKKGLTTGSVADQYQSCLPPWLQMAELGSNKVLDGKARDNGVLLNTKVGGLQQKWDNICHLHHAEPTASNCCPPHFPTIVGFQMAGDRKHVIGHGVSSGSNVPPAATRWTNGELQVPIDSLPISKIPSEVGADNIQFKQWEASSKKEDDGSCGLGSPSMISSFSRGNASQTSLSQTTSMTTDLGLRMNCLVNNVELKTSARQNQNQRELLSLSSHGSPDVDHVSGSVSDHRAQSSSSSSPDLDRQFDPSEFKRLFKELIERVGWQNEAIHDICQIMARYWMKNEKHEAASLRKGIWFHFLGPDRCGKRRVAAALAERCGSEENRLFADFGPRDHGLWPLDSLEMSGYDVASRGKTLVDFIASELRKKPSLLVFLENVDRADVITQNILSRAVRSGKFSDSHGREVGVSNAVFMTTSTFSDDEILSSRKDLSRYAEDKVLRAKGWPLQMIVGQAAGHSGSIFLNKRKSACTNENHNQHEMLETVKRVHTSSPRILDLNLDPVEEKPTEGSEDGSCDSDSISDSSRTWLQGYLELVDRTISFKPFDFDALATRLLDEINEAFHKIAGPEPLFEIEPKVMEQLLAAAYLSETKRVVEDWVGQVLSWGFVQAAKRYNLGPHSVVRLVACKDPHTEGTKPGVYLPRKIILN